MDTFQKFVSLYNIDSRFQTEIGEGFLWYHCRATGERAADSRLLIEYYRAAETEPPTLEELESSFVESRGSVTKGAEPHMFRIKQTAERWFKDNFEKAVFEANLPLFTVQGSSVEVSLSDTKNQSIQKTSTNNSYMKVLHLAKEHPIAAWISLIATVTGLILAISSLLRP